MSEPTPVALGKVAAPPDKEATSDEFYFWAARDRVVERTQVVTTTADLGGREVRFVGLVEEVYRQSRQASMGEEVDRFDADPAEAPPFASAGFTYARAKVLRTDPVCHAPPTEEAPVDLGDEAAARLGYGVDAMGQALPVGLLRNGGTAFAGPASIDLDYLLGENGGHLNVNGVAGLGAKSSFLLHVNALLLAEADRQRRELGVSHGERLQIVPVIFNVKNFDLFFIDHWGKKWNEKKGDALPEWRPLGVHDPAPFRDVRFFAPAEPSGNPVDTGRAETTAYSWSLADVIAHGLFRYLFSEEDIYDANFGGLVGDLEDHLTDDRSGEPRLKSVGGIPDTFAKLVDWFRENRDKEPKFKDSAPGTRGKLLRRLKYIVNEGDGVLRKNDPQGKPLVLDNEGGRGPTVIDLFGLRTAPSLQRFVVAAVFHQLVRNRSGSRAVKGLRYVVTLDELNRFAPKSGSDPITKKIVEVAAEMRSQGVILLGAQQQASLVAPQVIENAAVRAVGRSGALEMRADVWRFLGDAARDQASRLSAEEKLLVLPSFRAPMLAKIPYPPWALKQEDAAGRYDPAAPGAVAVARKPDVTTKFA
ncbi:MAG: ATP-binding protein [Gemmataceae bacterium]|nr:ATP-binding protein [Gemmataceae bacterium]